MDFWTRAKKSSRTASTKQAYEPPNWYDKVAEAMENDPDCISGPSPLLFNMIMSCTPTALEPKDRKKRPLLALARERVEWFKCLIQKCDPAVTWVEEGKTLALGKYLFGRPTYAIWLPYMNKWEDDREPITIGDSRSSSSGGHDRHDNRWWWSEFGGMAVTLGLTATAVAAALTTGLAFPAVAVGPVIWTVLRTWHGSFKTKLEQSPNQLRLLDVFGHLTASVGTTVDQLNTKIKEAEETLSIDPKGAAAEIANQKFRVVLLQTCLDREVTRMEDTAACNEDEIMARIDALFDFQRKLQKDLEQRRVSEDLQRVVSALERVEGLLCDVFRSQSRREESDANDGTQTLRPWVSGAGAGAAPRSSGKTISRAGTSLLRELEFDIELQP